MGVQEEKGMSTALAVVVGIIVLLIVAMAVIGVTNMSISGLSKKSEEVNENIKSNDIVCRSYVTKSMCESHGCKWDDKGGCYGTQK